ncbi:MAG: AbrB/MazE/SpoVT family DNA-binding domain-containing protein, partial [Nanoarchaeota archaeon]
MVQIDTTKVSSKGQIVIPISMRDNFKEDIEFAKKTEQAYERHKRGEFKSLPANKFLEELDK